MSWGKYCSGINVLLVCTLSGEKMKVFVLDQFWCYTVTQNENHEVETVLIYKCWEFDAAIAIARLGSKFYLCHPLLVSDYD